MKNIKNYLKILLVVFMIVPLIGLTNTYALGKKSLDDIKIDATNYNQYREQLELDANGSNVIDRTTFKKYKFGTYATTQVDGWNVNILSTEVGADGFHTIRFEADAGYKLPEAKSSGDTRFAKVSVSYMSGQRYTVENNVGILKFKPNFEKFNTITSYVSPNVVYVHLVGIPENIQEKNHLADYVFVEVHHQGQDVNDIQVHTGITPIVDGSRTYLVKKNEPFKVYYMNQEHMKPIETQPSKTGVSYQHDDYRNRYRVIEGSKTDTTNKLLAYDTTIFNVFVYSFTKAKYIRLDSYDFYWDDNTVQLPDYNNENIVYPGLRVVGFEVQQLEYQSHMANDPQWSKFNTGLDYTWSTKASDYNVQWTSTGVDGGTDFNRYSSLRHRFGEIYLTPTYQYEYTVRFLDYDGTVLNTQMVLKGEDASAPKDPSREGYTFEGWDKEYINIQGNLDVHATYKQNEIPVEPPVEPDTTKVKVTFVDHDGTVLKEESLDKGANATAPTSPQREGYKFVGWDKTFINVQENLTVKALYEVENEVALPVPPATPDVPTPPTPPTETPPIITAPETPTGTETPAPAGPTVNVPPIIRDDNQENNDQTVIGDQDVPQGNGDTVIDENQTPQAKMDGAWALINLICVVLTFITGLILVLSKHKDEEDKKDCQTEYERTEFKRRRWTKLFSVLVTIVSIIVFVLTEDITLPMQLVDKYTFVMAAILIVQLAVLIIGRKFKKEENSVKINEG